MLIQEHLTTQVTKDCDVLVCGGGFAGIAAAAAAARSGKKVILAEKMYLLGGLATAGLVTIYLPLCDGYGKQVSFGIAEELLRLSVSLERYDTRGTANWLLSDDPAHRTAQDPRFEVDFNPHLFAIQAEQWLLRMGVELLYGTYAVAASVSGDKLQAVILENKSGRFGISARSFVDATGDADLAVFAGAPTRVYSLGNQLASWYYYGDADGVHLKMSGYVESPDAAPDHDTARQSYVGLDGDEISRFIEDSHASMLNDVLRHKEKNPAYSPVTMATMPQLRMTRRIDGEYTQDVNESHVRFEDSIGMAADWRHRGPVYEIPFRSLYSAKIRNLIFAGRNISVTDELWELLRVIPCCSVMGEAAGVAAAMTDDFSALSIERLQAELRRRGVVIHEDDLENKAKYPMTDPSYRP